MAASDSQVRAWAHENGVDVSDRGRVGQDARDAYNAAHNGGSSPPPDYPEGMTEADFTAEAQPPDDVDDYLAETPPARPSPKASSRSTGSRLAGRLRHGKSGGSRKAKAKQARVSTADFIGSAWRIGAKIAQPMPPMYRTLRLQSVVAGPLLDDAVKGTAVDPFLQPLARLTRAGETVSALLLPPAAIGAMAVHMQQTGGEPNPVIMQACAETLRHGLMAMMRVGGDAFATQLAREREDQEQFGGSVEAVMAWIMAPPGDPAAEEAMFAQMTMAFAGEPVPEPEPEPV